MGDEAGDEQLMRAYAGGDAAAFEELYARYRKSLYGFLLRQCGDPEMAEELYQEVWIKLIRSRERYQVRARFRTFLFSIAHNVLIDSYRSAGRRPDLRGVEYDEGNPSGDHGPPPLPEPEGAAVAGQLAERLLTLLAELPTVQREAFLLKEEGGMNLAEIAEVTGAEPEAVKSRLRYAWAKLRGGLQDND